MRDYFLGIDLGTILVGLFWFYSDLTATPKDFVD
jgi:hypothetical protein